jgi:NAD(P)-dependent dehydrogenase (short-subunit alcohol dehydrogenase family)
MTEIDFTDQVALVTGAGSGLGRAYALALAARGAAVVVNDLPGSPSAADGVVAEITGAGGRAVAAYGSVASADDAAAAVATALDAYGRLDAVVNNAGSIRPARFEDMTLEQFSFMLDVHLVGTFHICQAAYRHMIGAGGGRIVNIASSAGAFGMPAMANYSAAKSGVVGLTRTLALEGAKHGVRVNAILPNAETTISKGHPIPGDSAADGGARAVKERLGDRFRPDSVAPLVVYLASSACALNGEAISALAGRFARVVIGVTRGWTGDVTTGVDAEELAEHLDDILELEGIELPVSVSDEYQRVADKVVA